MLSSNSMRRISPDDLEAGKKLERDLYYLNGHLLLPEGESIKDAHLDALRKLGLAELYQPEPGENVGAFIFECQYIRVELDSLESTRSMPYDLFDVRAPSGFCTHDISWSVNASQSSP